MVFIGAENSMGFHNPSEAGRVLADALAFCGEAKKYATAILAKRGVDLDSATADVTAYLLTSAMGHPF